MDTLWHTSDNRAAVKSLISLCLIDGYPPLGHDSTCQTEKWVPQAQFSGAFAGLQPYNVEPKHHKRLLYGAQSHILQVHGRTESQVEAPFSWERSMACAREGGRISFRVEAAFSFGFVDFGFGRKLILKDLIFILLYMIWSTRGCVTFIEAEYSVVER